MARKIIQMLNRDDGLYVLCNDSSLWRRPSNKWYEVDVEEVRQGYSVYSSENDEDEFADDLTVSVDKEESADD
jgi:hypothetical protein